MTPFGIIRPQWVMFPDLAMHMNYVFQRKEETIGHTDKSHNVPLPYPTMHHSEKNCTDFCSQWCIVGYGTVALWDFWDLVWLFWHHMLIYFHVGTDETWKEWSKAILAMVYRADSRFAPSQWEMPLLCNDASHWLGASLESTLVYAWHVSWWHSLWH